MYLLPTSQREGFGIPLSEHTGLLLVNGLVQDDLDDRHDIIRGALEIDPLLASWTVCAADRTGSRLSSLAAASRWLADCATEVLEATCDVSEVLDANQRVAWQRVAISAVATARLAWKQASRVSAASGSKAFWLGLLCGADEQTKTNTRQNGDSSRNQIRIPWPSWLVADFRSIRQANGNLPAEFAVRAAMLELADGRSAIADIVSQEETDLWFRPYPEFRSLVPSVLRKLKRLDELNERFEETLQREKLASLQQLAYGASHEINNPLANISTRAQTMLGSERDVEQRKKLIAINEQAFRAYEMIADLMLFAKPPELNIEEYSLDSSLRSLLAELEPLAAKKKIQVQFALGDDPKTIVADATQISVALHAICVNAIEAMSEGGVLSLSTRMFRRGAEINIEDTGPGLSDEARRHLFDPFFSGREAGRGLGFGLSKSWRIIQLHGGTIQVASQPKQGSSFRISIPKIDLPSNSPTPGRSEQV